MKKVKEYSLNMVLLAIAGALMLATANAALTQIDRQVCGSASVGQYNALGCAEVK